MPRHIAPALIAVMVLAGCASAPGQRAQMGNGLISGISALHSEVDMQLRLATATPSTSCVAAQCADAGDFERRVARIGDRLSVAAFELYPALRERIPKFDFVVADKADCQSGSTAGGTILLLRGMSQLEWDDHALAFVIGREMAHVIVGHHEDNTATSIVISLVAQLFLPVLNVFAAGSSATTAMVTSAASMVGARAMQASYRPAQLEEAEGVGLGLLARAGFHSRHVADSLGAMTPNLPLEQAWVLELRGSIQRVAKLLEGPPLMLAGPAPQPDRPPQTVIVLSGRTALERVAQLRGVPWSY